MTPADGTGLLGAVSAGRAVQHKIYCVEKQNGMQFNLMEHKIILKWLLWYGFYNNNNNNNNNKMEDVFTFKRDRLPLYDEGFHGDIPVIGESIVGQELIFHRLLQIGVIEQFIEHVHEFHNEAATPANTMTS